MSRAVGNTLSLIGLLAGTLLLTLAPPTYGAVAAVTSGSVSRHVIIVGVNRSVDPGVPALRYADDDAARYAEVLGSGADSLIVLSSFDAETQARYPQLLQQVRPPTSQALQRAAAETFAAIQSAQQQGQDADLLFVYIGHGAVDDSGEGYVSLQGGRLQRSQLFSQLIAPSPARFNHVIVDACSAYHLLNRGPEAVRAVRSFLSRSTLADHPNTGALLAASRDRVTHEWSRIGGGVFSHEILSALLGAADVDSDGAVQYQEIGAFVEAANEGIADRRARVDLYLRPPQQMVQRPVWSTTTSTLARLQLESVETGHYAISDARGVVVAELNKNGEQAISVALAGTPPFTVSQGEHDRVTGAAPSGVLKLAQLQTVTRTLRERSAQAAALERGLFSVPFGKSYVRGYTARLQRELASDDDVVTVAPALHDGAPTWISYGALGSGALLGVVSLTALGYGVYELVTLNQGKGEISAFEAQSHADWANVALWTGAVSGGLAISSLVVGAALADSP